MKKALVAGIVVIAMIAAGALGGFKWYVGVHNELVTKDEGVKSAWSQVESVYQRRLDLIPNLVATVKGYAAHEQETLTAVTEARSKIGQVNLSSDMINDPQALQNFSDAQAGLAGALSKLMVVVEKYPELKAQDNFIALQSQLEGTENRISVERRRYNEQAEDFNVSIRQFPASIAANIGGFTPKAYFKAQAGAEQAPKVEF
jgi:LemA protein